MFKKSLRGTIVALFFGAAAASEQELTQAEKGRALEYLESTKQNVLQATAGTTGADQPF